MALDYRKCAEEISANIGGGANVISAAHCATRLRLVIADNSKVNKAALENVDGVKGMFESNGQLQLIIGTGTVNKVYDEFLSDKPVLHALSLAYGFVLSLSAGNNDFNLFILFQISVCRT